MPTLSMPVNINQNYDAVANTRLYGCTVSCACDVASYYGNTTYTLNDMKNSGVFTDTDATCYWGNVPDASFASVTFTATSSYYSRIRSEIDAGRPVVVRMNSESGHYVVAYGYTGHGASPSLIYVLDPYNSTGRGVKSNDPNGCDHTLQDAFNVQGATKPDLLMVTAAK